MVVADKSAARSVTLPAAAVRELALAATALGIPGEAPRRATVRETDDGYRLAITFAGQPAASAAQGPAATTGRRGGADRDTSLRGRIAEAVQGLDADRLDELRGVLDGPETDDLDDRLWGPAPARAEATAATLADLQRQQRDRRRVADDALSRQEAAELLGISPQAVTDRLDAGRLVGMKVGRQWRLPTWQFDLDAVSAVLPGLDRLQEVFPGGPVSLSRWIAEPSPDLDGRTPRQALAGGDGDRVCAVAAALTAAGW